MVYFLKRYKFIILITCLIIIGFIFILQPYDQEPQQIESAAIDQIPEFMQEGTTQPDQIEEVLMVDIKGAIQDPGVYEVDQTARLYDVIQLAGGFTKEANEVEMNLAQRVHDEMYIYVPEKGEVKENIPQEGSGITHNENGIRVNRASLEELQTLDGIGPGKAQAILDYIAENGPFTKAEDLLQVSGIGEKTLEKFKENIIIP